MLEINSLCIVELNHLKVGVDAIPERGRGQDDPYGDGGSSGPNHHGAPLGAEAEDAHGGMGGAALIIPIRSGSIGPRKVLAVAKAVPTVLFSIVRSMPHRSARPTPNHQTSIRKERKAAPYQGRTTTLAHLLHVLY